LDSNLKPRREKLTPRKFYYANIGKNNAGKNDSGAGEDDSGAGEDDSTGLPVTRPMTSQQVQNIVYVGV
jgi:hypothetical protein